MVQLLFHPAICLHESVISMSEVFWLKIYFKQFNWAENKVPQNWKIFKIVLFRVDRPEGEKSIIVYSWHGLPF